MVFALGYVVRMTPMTPLIISHLYVKDNHRKTIQSAGKDQNMIPLTGLSDTTHQTEKKEAKLGGLGIIYELPREYDRRKIIKTSKGCCGPP